MATENSGDRNMSKASIEAATQAAFALCATCAHERGGHPEGGACSKVWWAGEAGKTEVHCRCAEYWAKRDEREDGMAIVDRVVSLGGGEKLVLDRRITAEFWDTLRQGHDVVVYARFSVSGKGYREKDYQLTETRRLRLAQLYFLRPEDAAGLEETNVILDASGNEVDPETGEIQGSAE